MKLHDKKAYIAHSCYSRCFVSGYCVFVIVLDGLQNLHRPTSAVHAHPVAGVEESGGIAASYHSPFLSACRL
jgi:hypothetical protein